MPPRTREQEEDLINQLIAEYVNTATNQDDYGILFRNLLDQTSFEAGEIYRMLADYSPAETKRINLQSVPANLIPRENMYGDDDEDPLSSPYRIDESLPGEEAGRERIPEDILGLQAAQQGALANFIQSNFGSNVGGAFRDFLTSREQQNALNSRFQLAGTARPEGRSLGFSDFMQGLGDQPGQAPFRTSGANRGQLDMLARYLATPDSGAFNIPDFQRSAIEDLRKQGGQQQQFNMLLNPALANLSPYARGGFRDSAQAGFNKWVGQNLDNPTAQYLPYARSRNFRL